MRSTRGPVAGLSTLCLFLAAPTLAQEPQSLPELGAPEQASPAAGPACGGATGVVWIAETDGADAATSEAPLSSALTTTGAAPAVVAFTTSAENLALRVEAQASDGDPSIILMTEDGQTIAENDDTPDSLNSRIETSVGPGTYCVALNSVGGSPLQATVQVSRADQPALLSIEPAGGASRIADCTLATEALPLTEGALDARLAEGAVTTVVDGQAVGYYRFTLSQPTTLTVRSVSSGLDPYLKLFNADGGLVGENDDTDGTNSRLDYATPLPAGDYCIGTAALSAGDGQIDLSVTALDRDSFLRQAWQRGEIVPPLDGSFPVEAFDLSKKQTVLLHDGGAKWVSFDVAKPTVLVVDAYGALLGVDTQLSLFAENGTPVANNDDYGDSTDSKLGPVLLEPGRYALSVIDLNRRDETGAAIRPVGVIVDRFERVE